MMTWLLLSVAGVGVLWLVWGSDGLEQRILARIERRENKR